MKTNLRIRQISSVFIITIFLVLAYGSDNKSDSSEEKTSSSANSNKGKEQTPEELKAQLQRELVSFEKPFDASTYYKSVESLQMELVLFGVWASVIDKGKASSDQESVKLAENLEKKVYALQVKELPLMRKEYGKLFAQKMWEHDIIVTTSGKANGTITFTGGLFAANKNIKEFQTTINEALNMFRFKEARYKWYKGDDEFTYYTIESPNDKTPITFSGN